MSALARAIGIAVLVMVPAQVAHADGIRLGDGSAFVVTTWPDYWDGTPSNSGVVFLPPDIITGVSGRELFANARTGCQPCAPGDTINLSGSFELRGSRYLSAGNDYSVYGTGFFNFHAPDVVVPDSGDVFATMTAPFTFDGYISLYRVPGDILFFQSAVYGDGLTRLWLSGASDARFFHQQQYAFGDDPFAAPVPEPATFLLCATGLAIATRRRLWVRDSGSGIRD